MAADSSASTVKSAPAAPSTWSTSAQTSLRTSLRTTRPPTAAAPPLLATMLTLDEMPAWSAALTVMLPPAMRLTFSSACKAGATLARARALIRLLANTMPAATLAPEALASLTMVAVTCSLARASTDKSPPAAKLEPVTVAKI